MDAPLQGARQDGAPHHSWGRSPWAHSAWGTVFGLEVATELCPFLSHPFPTLVALATVPGGDRTPSQGHPATPAWTMAGGCDAPGVEASGCSSQ